MNKTITICIAVSILTGCQPDSLRKAQQDYSCHKKGGVYTYGKVFGTRTEDVKCRNGETVEVPYDQWLPSEFYPEVKNEH